MAINESTLKATHIYDLRVYAKQCGVKAPTTKTKLQLIEEILEIKKGKLKPVYAKRGRKNIHSLELKKEEETYYDFYKANLSEHSSVEISLNIANEYDFLIYFDELIKNSFNADITQINTFLYKLGFDNETVFIELKEEISL